MNVKFFFLIILAFAFVFVPFVHAQDNCTTSTCHQSIAKLLNESAWKHAPASKHNCKVCHKVSETKITGKHDVETLSDATHCYTCHKKEKKKFLQKTIHSPVADGDCLSCHNPHAGAQKYNNENTGKLCSECHDVVYEILPNENVHSPALD